MESEEFSPGMLAILKKIQALLDKQVSKGCTPEEASAAAAKAQELLVKYNLDASLISRGESQDGRREEQKLRGGFYEYQQQLWRAVAELNFCLYWCQDTWETRVGTKRRHGQIVKGEFEFKSKRHRLVGRVVNVRATVAMAQYLEQAIERLVNEKIGTDRSLAFSRWTMSYREGMVATLTSRIYERHRERLSEERRREQEAREAAVKAGAEGASTGTALVLANYFQSEREANADFLYGEGWSARMRAERQAAAEEARRRQEEYTKWAAAHPEEARAKEEEARKEREAQDKRYRSGGAGSRGGTSHEKKRDWSAFEHGRQKGRDISLDPQVGSGSERRIGRQR